MKQEASVIFPSLNSALFPSSQVMPSFRVLLNGHEAHPDSINPHLFPWHLEGYFIIL